MHIEHIAIWTQDLERSKAFYLRYFSGSAGENYRNDSKGLTSCFIIFDGNARLEIMQMDGAESGEIPPHTGIAHFAVSLGSKEAVDLLTNKIQNDGWQVAGHPRKTGDGYYESVVLDPDGNRIELTV